MISPPRTCVTALSPTSASVSTFLGPRSTPRQPRPRHIRDRTGKPLLPPGNDADTSALTKCVCVTASTSHRHHEDDQHNEERFAPDAATADRARRRPSRPAEDRARRRLATLSYRRGEEQAQPKYGRRLLGTRRSGAALALLIIELVPDQWLGHRRAARAGRTVVACS